MSFLCQGLSHALEAYLAQGNLGEGITHLHPVSKTALGAFDYVPWTYYERNRDCIDALKEMGMPVVAVETVEGAVAHTRFDWPQPVAVVFGNEENGVNERVLRRCDAVVRIPMLGHKNSMNVATAFGVVAYGILHHWGVV